MLRVALALLLPSCAALGCRADEHAALLADGEACNDGRQCGAQSGCFDGRCVSYDAYHEQGKARALAEIEGEMLRQSGVDARTGLPTQPRPAATPGAIVLRTTASTESARIFAACARDERLISGGCESRYLNLSDSYPASAEPGDTLGGRWHCSFTSDRPGYAAEGERRAHALCMPVAPVVGEP